MSVGDTLGPLFTLLVIVNAMGTALPLLRHVFVWSPFVFVLFGLCILFLLMAALFILGDATVSLYDVTAKGQVNVHSIVSFDLPVFFQVNVTMTTVMAASVLGMVAWLCYESRRAWRVYILPMLHDLNALESSCWSDVLDLRNRVVPISS